MDNFRTKYDDEAEARTAALVKTGVSHDLAVQIAWQKINYRLACEQGTANGEPNA